MMLSSLSASVHTSWLSGTGRKSLTSTRRVGRSTVIAPPNSSRRPVGSGGCAMRARDEVSTNSCCVVLFFRSVF